jgi:hypothetical protein
VSPTATGAELAFESAVVVLLMGAETTGADVAVVVVFVAIVGAAEALADEDVAGSRDGAPVVVVFVALAGCGDAETVGAGL